MNLSPEQREQLKYKIETLEYTIKRLEELCPTLGDKWQKGMIRYYKERLEELRRGFGSDSKAK